MFGILDDMLCCGVRQRGETEVIVCRRSRSEATFYTVMSSAEVCPSFAHLFPYFLGHSTKTKNNKKRYAHSGVFESISSVISVPPLLLFLLLCFGHPTPSLSHLCSWTGA